MKKNNNLAFIDGQNLYMGTRSDKPAWNVDLKKGAIHLTASGSLFVLIYSIYLKK